MKHNLCMLDFAVIDPRSASAMLVGTGDGREQDWLKFELAHPEITDQEVLMVLFGREARYGRIGAKKKPIWWFVLLTLVVLS